MMANITVPAARAICWFADSRGLGHHGLHERNYITGKAGMIAGKQDTLSAWRQTKNSGEKRYTK
jgi:hypothetical protein